MEQTAFKKNALWEDYIPFGWHGIYQHLIMRMAEIDPTLRVISAREKLGALRISVDRYNRDVELYRQEIETWSASKCQTCGCPGQLMVSPVGYYATLCAAHAGASRPSQKPTVHSIIVHPDD